MTSPTSYADVFSTPLGDVLAVADERGRALRLEITPRPSRAAAAAKPRLAIEARERALGVSLVRGPQARERTAAIREQVQAYFAQTLQRFELELAPRGTDFQRRVWKQLAAIPFGATTSYGALAEALGQPGSARAVGHANGKNPLWLILPCHRVVAANGALTGYAGGLDIKRALLELEGVALDRRGVRPDSANAPLFP